MIFRKDTIKRIEKDYKSYIQATYLKKEPLEGWLEFIKDIKHKQVDVPAEVIGFATGLSFGDGVDFVLMYKDELSFHLNITSYRKNLRKRFRELVDGVKTVMAEYLVWRGDMETLVGGFPKMLRI